MDGISRQLSKAQGALAAGRGEAALTIGRELVRKHPRAAAPLHFVGQAYCMAGKPSLALPFLRRAAIAKPDDAVIALTLAHALSETGLVEEAIAVIRGFEKSVETPDRTTVDQQMTLGNLYRRQGSLADAHACFVRARDFLTARQPTSADDHDLAGQLAAACNNVANVLCEAARFDEAIAEYCRAIETSPEFADAWTNLAAALFATGRFEEAAAAARRAVTLAPQQTAARLTLGNALGERGEWAEARRAFDAVAALEPLSLAARYNRSLARLALGDWSAWDDYRLRHVVEPTVAAASGLPRWVGESLEGKTILVRREQGIGTQIMFSGFLPTLANMAGKVFVECDARLRRLFSRTLPGIDFAPNAELFVVDRKADGAVKGPDAIRWLAAKPDVEVAIGDLPGFSRRYDERHDWRELVLPPRLCADAELVQKWRERLARLGGGLCVGVSWRGGGTSSARHKRSTALDEWSPVFAAAGVEFVSLQYGDVDREVAEHERRGGKRLYRWDDFDPRDDLDDLAALIGALDLVVSIDNSTVHLAGAVGATVWVLLPRAADWRWLIARSDSPWYASAELFRPTCATDGWVEVLAGVGERLEQFVHQRRRGAAHAG